MVHIGHRTVKSENLPLYSILRPHTDSVKMEILSLLGLYPGNYNLHGETNFLVRNDLRQTS